MKKIVYAVLGMMLFASCNKEESFEVALEEKSVPEFTVTTEKTTYAVGERVTFNIEGDAGLLEFWSGEIGNDYDYRDGRIIPAPERIEFSFEANIHYWNGTTPRRNGKVLVLVSTDFNGNRESYDDINAATWTDITDRCIIDYDLNAYVSSGTVDVTDLREEGKPIYFAFKYEFNPPPGAAGRGVTVWIRNIVIQTVVGEDIFVLNKDRTLTQDYPAFSTGSPTKHPEASDNFTSLLRFTANKTGTFNGVTYTLDVPNEDYWVTPGYDVWATRDLGPDQPVTVTRLNRPIVSTVTHDAYSTPGVYKVRFVGTDPSLKENNQTVRELEITIVPAE